MKNEWTLQLALLLTMLFAAGGQAHADDIRKGDANADRDVNVADIVVLQRKINLDPPAGMNLWAADLNGDDAYDVADIVLIRNIINYGSVDGGGTIKGWTEGNNDGEQLTQDLEEDEGD